MGSIDVLGELARLVAEDAVSEQSLAAMTGIDAAKIHSALVEDRPRKTGVISAGRVAFTPDETMRLSMLAGQLAEGMTVGDDDRLTSILESLTAEVHLTAENIARLTGVEVADVASALRDPRSLSPEVRYEIGIRTSYLINVVNVARGR